MKYIQDQFKGDDSVNFLTITMDPEFDKAPQLKSFGQKFAADFKTWNFLTGDHDKIIKLAQDVFKVPADKDPEMHTTRMVLVDADLNHRGFYQSLEDESIQKLIQDIKNIKRKV